METICLCCPVLLLSGESIWKQEHKLLICCCCYTTHFLWLLPLCQAALWVWRGKKQLITIELDRFNMADVFTAVESLSQAAFKAVIFLTGEQTWILHYSQLWKHASLIQYIGRRVAKISLDKARSYTSSEVCIFQRHCSWLLLWSAIFISSLLFLLLRFLPAETQTSQLWAGSTCLLYCYIYFQLLSVCCAVLLMFDPVLREHFTYLFT